MNDTEQKIQEKINYPPIRITDLEVGTNFLIQTQNDEVYELIVLNPTTKEVRICGGKLWANGVEVTLVGSYWEDEYGNKQEGIIQKGLCIEFKVPNTSIKCGYHHVSTTPVQTVNITASDNSWKFEMWENNK